MRALIEWWMGQRSLTCLMTDCESVNELVFIEDYPNEAKD